MSVHEMLLLCCNTTLTDIVNDIANHDSNDLTMEAQDDGSDKLSLEESIKGFVEESKTFNLTLEDTMLLYHLYRLNDLHNTVINELANIRNYIYENK